MTEFAPVEHGDGFVRVPISLAERLVAAAQNHLARQSRYVDPDADPDADPISLVFQWVASLEQARTQPTPSAEPGDLLVKLARAEFWTFTVHGWRELAPIELQTEGADPWPPRPFEFQDGDPMPQRAKDVGYRNIDRDARAGAGGVCGRHGVYDGVVCPTCRREAAETVAEISDRIRVAEAAQAAPDPLSPAIRAAFDELQAHAEVLEHVADALAGGDDGGNNSPSFESIAQARTFARALHYAREVIWKHQGAS